MSAPRHRNAARREGWPPTHCDGYIRRIFVRTGAGKYYVPIGRVCDACGVLQLDDDRAERIAEHKAKAPWRTPESV